MKTAILRKKQWRQDLRKCLGDAMEMIGRYQHDLREHDEPLVIAMHRWFVDDRRRQYLEEQKVIAARR